MKELIKPNAHEELNREITSYCEVDCTGGGSGCEVTTANKGCMGGGANNSISEESDILLF